ncbi:hypothetical protein DMH04_00140 [Kibdelosporangium aridum]|uniref:Uncharacterized protein n=1 Tax=Kibdelosporangium aridum TaxID=2030 RepID=A0A428ZTQ2_KIBAR|nr:hypothetical protein [Kibdelosporangium aridum]RSM91459.1 hypothetical protein DMH04_00140 [Kibdelosporangium aridum]
MSISEAVRGLRQLCHAIDNFEFIAGGRSAADPRPYAAVLNMNINIVRARIAGVPFHNRMRRRFNKSYSSLQRIVESPSLPQARKLTPHASKYADRLILPIEDYLLAIDGPQPPISENYSSKTAARILSLALRGLPVRAQIRYREELAGELREYADANKSNVRQILHVTRFLFTVPMLRWSLRAKSTGRAQ